MKKVAVECWAPFAVEPTATQPWADVSIWYRARPGRRKYEFNPTLCSRGELRTDLREAKSAFEADQSGENAAELARLENFSQRLEREGVVMDMFHPDPTWPNIYTSAETIDRAQAEVILAAFLLKLGFRRVKFRWIKPHLILHAASFSD